MEANRDARTMIIFCNCFESFISALKNARGSRTDVVLGCVGRASWQDLEAISGSQNMNMDMPACCRMNVMYSMQRKRAAFLLIFSLAPIKYQILSEESKT